MTPDSAPDSDSLDSGAFFANPLSNGVSNRVSGRSENPGSAPPPYPIIVVLLAAPYLVLACVGATEAHVPGTLGCLAIAFLIYWYGCVESRFDLSEGRIL
ncbi:MAG: hypothetical protein ABIW76_18025, partial [Fibrobacteria bacterium]